jgi:polar amino acid transport system substrate-binding protein
LTDTTHSLTQFGIQHRTKLKAHANPSLEAATPFQTPVDKNGNPAVNYLGAGFRKGDTDLIKAYNDGLAKMKADGSLKTLIAPFGFVESEVAGTDVATEQLCKA